MSPFKFAVQSPPKYNALVVRGPKGDKGDTGADGPSNISNQTLTDLVGLLSGDGEKVGALPAPSARAFLEVFSQTETLAAITAALAAYTPTSGLSAVAFTGSASSLAVGTLADARLSPNVPLKNAASIVFTGAMTVNGAVTVSADIWSFSNRIFFGSNNTVWASGQTGTNLSHSWRNFTGSDLMQLYGNGNLVVNGTAQIGGASGPVLKNYFGSLTVRNATDTGYMDGYFNTVVATNPNVGSNATPADAVISLRAGGIAYGAGEIIGRVRASNVAHGDLIFHARPNGSVYSPTDDVVIRGNTGNVEINRGNLILASAKSINMSTGANTFSTFTGGVGNYEGMQHFQNNGQTNFWVSSTGTISRGLVMVLGDDVAFRAYDTAASYLRMYGTGKSDCDLAGGSTVRIVTGGTPRITASSTGAVTVANSLGVGATPTTHRLFLASTTSGSSLSYETVLVSVKANADASAHARLIRTGISEWYLSHNSSGGLELALAANVANPDFTFANGIFVANGQVKIGNTTGVRLKNNAGSVDIKNDGDTDFARVNLSEIRGNGLSYSRFAQVTTAGSWGGGYNINFNSGTSNRDSTGAVSGVLYGTTGIAWYAEPSAAPAAITARMTLVPSKLTVNTDGQFGTQTTNGIVTILGGQTTNVACLSLLKWGNREGYIGQSTNLLCIGVSGGLGTYSDSTLQSNAAIQVADSKAVAMLGTLSVTGAVSGASFASAGTIQVGTGGSLLKNNGGVVQIRNSVDTAFASLEGNNLTANNYLYATQGWFAGAGGAAFMNGALGVGSAAWLIYTANSNTLYVRDGTNARMHVTFSPGTTVNNANTTIDSILTVNGTSSFAGGTDANGGRISIYGSNSYAAFAIGKNGDPDAFRILNTGNWLLGSTENKTIDIQTDSVTRLSIAGTGAVTVSGALAVVGNVTVTGDTRVSSVPPATSSSVGVSGTITYDANFVYVCTATNTWKRAALSTW